ncbi:MAG: hypothetical protein J6A59_05745 [Lachnospiraceae bacterium]|nr:hypothetical protein [Lachnospiraceae bacterium]MBO5407469.1 hypothetical protein [Bacteroidales bacterium]
MIGNDTLLGQIATLIETLHLSYEEVVYKIPYRNLLIMQKDRLHACIGERIQKVSGADMAARRMGG